MKNYSKIEKQKIKANFTKKAQIIRVQAIIILFDHQHVDIMFFPNNDDNDKTEVFLKGAKFFSTEALVLKFDVFDYFFLF